MILCERSVSKLGLIYLSESKAIHPMFDIHDQSNGEEGATRREMKKVTKNILIIWIMIKFNHSQSKYQTLAFGEESINLIRELGSSLAVLNENYPSTTTLHECNLGFHIQYKLFLTDLSEHVA
ncbi:hypothetical protein FGO68_gene6595 [Halteria grandinella]|uniref:Uncharacterized protein n=1 Tax=Halteria grandinella TaxID=5974 RepID=A0A8J8NDQ1_HALGN|nr:hypothetical protein FGO68_gene6595 [Halteria grandinella]